MDSGGKLIRFLENNNPVHINFRLDFFLKSFRETIIGFDYRIISALCYDPGG